MSKKYIATIMDRHYIGENDFIYNANHVAIGELDDKTKIFKDLNGNEYFSILDENLFISKIPFGYANITPISNIRETFGHEMTQREAISAYEKYWRKIIYYTSKTKDDKICFISCNMEEIKNELFDPTDSNMLEENNFDLVEDEISNGRTQNYKEYSYYDIGLNLDSLLMDVKDDVYSSSELKKIKKELLMTISNAEATLNMINSKIDSTKQKEIRKSTNDVAEEAKKVEEQRSIKTDINIDEIFKNVTKTLIAQDKPARRVITEIVRKEMDPRKKKEAILLTGNTGVGKTELMRLIAKYLKKPFIKVDSTQLTIPGYVGKDIEEVLWDLYEKCNKNKEQAENAIVFFDEIDKKGSTEKSDVSGQGVLNVLLSFITGAEYDATASTKIGREKVKMNTSNMTVILGGAFTDVYKCLQQIKEMGFRSGEYQEKEKKATIDDFIQKAKMTDEFMGRVTIVKMNDLDVNAIKRIMLESDESAIKIQQEIFNKLNVKLTFTDEYIAAVATDAVDKKTGARGLNSVVDDSTWCAFDEVYSNMGVYSEVILDEKTIEDPTHYQLVKKQHVVKK